MIFPMQRVNTYPYCIPRTSLFNSCERRLRTVNQQNNVIFFFLHFNKIIVYPEFGLRRRVYVSYFRVCVFGGYIIT